MKLGCGKLRFPLQRGTSRPSDISPLEHPAPTDCLFQGQAEHTEQSAAFKSKKSVFIQLLPALILLRNMFVHPLHREGCAEKVRVHLKTADSAAFGCHSQRRLLRPYPGKQLARGSCTRVGTSSSVARWSPGMCFPGELLNSFRRPNHQDMQRKNLLFGIYWPDL